MVVELFDNRDMFDFTNDWDYILFSALCKYFSNVQGESWFSTKECLDLMFQEVHFDSEDKVKPSIKWVGRVMSRIDLFKKRRVAAGVQYALSLELLEKYMLARGWIKPKT